jgi:two-component system response regulator NreC
VSGEQQALSVVVVDDHEAVRRGLELLLRAGGHRVAGSAGSAAAGAALILRRRPDVALVDLGLPDEGGAELARRLLAEAPELRILIYTGATDEDALVEGLASGAAGVALKSGGPQELDTAIRAVARGEAYVDPLLAPLLAARDARIRVLSPREVEVLRLLALGLSGERAAAELHLSPETVRTHVRNSMTKLRASTRVHAVALALSQGEITIEQGRRPGPPPASAA